MKLRDMELICVPKYLCVKCSWTSFIRPNDEAICPKCGKEHVYEYIVTVQSTK